MTSEAGSIDKSSREDDNHCVSLKPPLRNISVTWEQHEAASSTTSNESKKLST